jgi:hypothetical protein
MLTLTWRLENSNTIVYTLRDKDGWIQLVTQSANNPVSVAETLDAITEHCEWHANELGTSANPSVTTIEAILTDCGWEDSV